MELLAPAGTKEALVAAVEAGADAVYIGIEGFNARQRARNFSMYDAEVMTHYLHSRKKRIYIAMNVLIKEREIPAVFDLLNRLSALSVDGLIVQDLGLIHLCRNYFKEIPLHASTQMAIHNSEGVKCLERLGMKRVILSRELSIRDIKEISEKTKLELEVFCHGALCFSVSGLCLASSYMGGHSGNRGLCTQPCRRLWKGDSKEGFFFSMRDLESGTLVAELQKAGVRSLKIEGRMRSPEYVKKVVQAYRMLIDGGRKSSSKKSGADAGSPEKFRVDDMARRKTQYFMLGKRGDVIDYDEPPTMGTLLGEVIKAEDGKAVVLLSDSAAQGDRVRIVSAGDDEIDAFYLKTVSFDPDGRHMSFDFNGRAAKGDRLFLLGRKGSELSSYSKKIDQLYQEYEKRRAPRNRRWSEIEKASMLKKLMSPWKRPQFCSRKPSVRIDDPLWIKFIEIKAVEDITIVIGAPFNNEFESLVSRFPTGRVIFELPLFVPESSLEPLKNTVKYLVKRGYRRWVVQNLSHFGIIPSGNLEITAGAFLYSLNSQALRQMKELGVEGSICSYEDEYLNIRDVLRHWDGIRKTFLFAHIPLFHTQVKIDPAISAMNYLSLSSTAAFTKRCGSGTAVVSARPFSIFQSREKLEMLRLQGFLIDLAFLSPSRELWKKVREHYEKSMPFQGSRKFNFKIGLK
ncbi:MAG: peptidase U32 family protein [Candidatus Xenobiia bacterium LiM19]